MVVVVRLRQRGRASNARLAAVATVISLVGVGRIIDVPKTITTKALLNKYLTLPTRTRVSKRTLACYAIIMNPHHKQVTAANLIHVSELLYNIPFCVNRIRAKSTTPRTRAETVARYLNNLSSPHKHR